MTDFSLLELDEHSSTSVVGDVHELLAREVHLLDDRKYHEWLQLFTNDCLYWMPVDPTVEDGSMRLNVFYDDRLKMEDRIARLTSGSAYTEDPPSMTARSISAIHVTENVDDLIVRSNFFLVAHRRDEQRLLAGRCRHRLVRGDDGLRIAEKRVTLLGSDSPQRAATFLF